MGLLANALASQPQAPRPTIGPTDVLGAYKLATDTAEQQYQAKLQQQNALWGGLAGLGGAGLTAYILKGGLFGKPAAAGASSPAAAAADATGTAGAANLTGPTQFAGTAGGATAPVTPVASSPLTPFAAPASTAAAPASSMFADAGTPMLSGADMAAAMPANSVVGGDFGALGLAPNSVVASDFASLPVDALPYAAGSTVAGDMAAAAPIAAEAASTAPAWGAGLADLLPFLFGM